MRHTPTIATVFILTILLSACATPGGGPDMMWKSQVGKYGENVRIFNEGIKTLAQADDMQIYAVCEALLETRDYGRLFTCLDEMDRRIEQGTYSAMMMSAEGVALMSKILRARGLLDLEESQKARAVAASSVLPDTIFGAATFWINHYGVRALAEALAGNHQEARVLLAKLEEEDNPIMIKEKNAYIARVYMALGEYEKALRVVEQDTSPSGFFAVAKALAYPVASVVSAGVATAAGGTAKEGLKLLVGDDDRVAVPYAFMVAKLHLETGQIDAARLETEAILNHPAIAHFGGLHWAALHNRASIHIKDGEMEQAIARLKEAVIMVEQHRSSIQGEAGRIGFVGNKQAVYQDLVAVLVDTGRPGEAFEYAERGKSRALVDLLAGKKTFATGNELDLEPLLADWKAAELDDATAGIRISTPSHRRAAQDRALTIRKKITATAPQVAALVTVSTPTLSEIRRQLPGNETLVEYFGSSDNLFVFVVDSKTVHARKLASTDLHKNVKRFREAVQNPKSSHYRSIGRQLYDQLLEPVSHWITSQRITIVPHGVLHYVPFAALGKKDGSLLIDHHTLRILPSASVLAFLSSPRKPHGKKPLLALGNPDLDMPKMDLPYAQQEVQAITADWNNSRPLTRKAASETVVKRSGSAFEFLHFACHGTFDPQQPLASGLLLAADSENDGMFTVGEIYETRLDADLVTLSACETALGKIAGGDDVVGFTRGFLFAGVNSIVSSLWKVDDRATSVLMQAFYAALKETDKRQALRTAQLKVKQTYNPHPYYWAAFQITGSGK